MTSQGSSRRAQNTLLAMLILVVWTQISLAQPPSALEDHNQAIAKTISEATKAYGEKDFEQSLKLFHDALMRGATQNTVSYNAACCAALCDKPGLAFEFLNQAVDSGWVNLKLLEKDSDLESLHSDPRWPKLLSSIEVSIKSIETRWKSKAFQTPYSDNLTDAEKAAGLSKLWSEVKFNFVNFHLVPELDWDAEYMACMTKVLATKSTFEYYRLLEELVAKLKDGHTNVYLPETLNQKFNARPSFRTTLIEGKVLVARILDPAIKEQGIEIGHELVAINKMPVKEYAAKNVQPYMSSSTPQDLEKRTFEHYLLRGPVDEPINLKLKKADGESLTVSVNRTTGKSRVTRFFSRPSPFEMKVLDGNLAYVRLNSFGTSIALTAFAKAFEKIEATDGLILDLRQNGGGNSGVGWSILGYLTDKRFQTTRWHTLQYRPTFRPWNRQPLSKHGSPGERFAPNAKHYKKPVVMLIGPETFSAAEDMAAAFDMLGRGKLIGQATGGSTGQPLMFQLPGGGRARVCTKHDSYADGTEFVGIGIQPDIEVRTTLEDFRKQFDRTLDVARKQMLRSIKEH